MAQGIATRDALISAARQLFGARGYADVSMDELAAAAGVTKGALYHHFAGKEAVFQAVYESVKHEITDTVAPCFLDKEPWTALVEGCILTIDAHLAPDIRRIVLVDGKAVLDYDVAQDVENRYGAIVLRGALRRAMHEGVIERMPLAPLARMLNGALTEACVLIADCEDPQATRTEVAAIVERMLSGLRPR